MKVIIHHLSNGIDACIADNLSNYEEIEWYQFQQLTESISMQPNGAREAIEAVRKKLKHGSTQQKLRVLEVNSQDGVTK